MNTFKKLGKKIISEMTTNCEYGWPPDCVGFVYQPERPVNTYVKDDSDKDDKIKKP